MTDVLLRLEDALWALYASGIQPGDDTERTSDLLNTLEEAYLDLFDTGTEEGLTFAERCSDKDVLSSIEEACQKIETSLPSRRFLVEGPFDR